MAVEKALVTEEKKFSAEDIVGKISGLLQDRHICGSVALIVFSDGIYLHGYKDSEGYKKELESALEPLKEKGINVGVISQPFIEDDYSFKNYTKSLILRGLEHIDFLEPPGHLPSIKDFENQPYYLGSINLEDNQFQ